MYPDTGYWLLDAGYWMLDTGCWDAGCRVGTGFTVPVRTTGVMEYWSDGYGFKIRG
ncbi:hypothetical protein D3OALGB2SA_1630 [Olavius algarvensis associated proteobacterium Delta 3]|nr:hypothetical protein D3OALGB2SA_1630 [Olavius algarvensis associated proteobacterium Delta 3]